MSASEVTAEATVVHVNLRDTQSMLEEGVIASLELNKVDYAVERNKSLRARYYFGIIFLIMNLVAWFFRDYGQSVLLPFIHLWMLISPVVRHNRVMDNDGTVQETADSVMA
ncbi:hypothetical protein glysoja_044746 [Glycine soja]|uniref:Uncharacterized protein n=1 Tax=Glycine soja TaxID=3848 RepID=A0A0B2RIH3_GLYSO|nr:hypothetical protein glysoja_044746 [Glycine soja]